MDDKTKIAAALYSMQNAKNYLQKAFALCKNFEDFDKLDAEFYNIGGWTALDDFIERLSADHSRLIDTSNTSTD